jgi:AcrR family transcriptional regulator
MSAARTSRKKPAGTRKNQTALRKRSSYHHGDLRNALVKAALALVEKQGAEAFTLREVARRAGVTHAAPYRHFRTKAALLAAVAEEGFRGLLASLEVSAERAGPELLAQFRGTSVGYVRFAINNQAHFRVMFGPFEALAEHPGLAKATRDAFEFLLNLIKACQQEGSIRQGNSEEIALSCWSLVHGIASLLVNGRLEVGEEKEMESLALRATALLEQGLLVAPQPALPEVPAPTRLPKIRGTARSQDDGATGAPGDPGKTGRRQ